MASATNKLTLIAAVLPAGVVSTLAGSAGNAGSSDGRGTSARFRYPSGVAVGRDGTVYVADTDNQVIKSITADGEVATIGGSNGGTGSTDGSSTTARFLNPKGLAVSADGKGFLLRRPVESDDNEAPVQVVLNWRGLLKR